MSIPTDELYQQTILDHNRNPRQMRRIEHPTHSAQGLNPVCGDAYTVYLSVTDGIIREATFEGHGCAISKASASLMCQALAGRTVAEAEGLFQAFHALVLGKGASHSHYGRGPPEGGTTSAKKSAETPFGVPALAGPAVEGGHNANGCKGAAPACELGKLKVFSGVWKYPARVKCAALCWHALHSALEGKAMATTENAM